MMPAQTAQQRKPETTRFGNTHKVKIGPLTMYLTVNRDAAGQIIEVFGKSDEGYQGHVDMACRLVSLGIQGRADIETVIRHMSHDKTEPVGGLGQPSSIYDGIAKVLEGERGGGANSS